jgi:hypothetical protein
MHNAFIQLNRTFHEKISKNGDTNEVDRIRNPLFAGQSLLWADLTQKLRVVILAEAGTGKTSEMRHMAKSLRNEDKYAFFIRLEYLCENFECAFECAELYKKFQTWLASNCEAWLLLDSVDEARLKDPRDFELAVRVLGSRIAAALQRTHVVISSRPSAWRSVTDLAICKSNFSNEFADNIKNQQTQDRAEIIRVQSSNEDINNFMVVSFDSLSDSKIEKLALAVGITDTNLFLDDMKKDNISALAFTSRPQDIIELAELWKQDKQINSLLKLMENRIESRLVERHQNHADVRPIDCSRLQEGANLVAAAVILTKKSAIRIPDGSNHTQGISTSDILPDWNDIDQSTLISRPIFESGFYGTVRFHHRSTCEFLTAKWLSKLLEKGNSRRSIESLFFKRQYDLLDVIVPTMRPILPWLAIFDYNIAKRLCEFAPEVIFEGGDPGELSLEIRRKVLHQVCEQIAQGKAKWITTGYEAVRRFAANDLTDEVNSLIFQYDTNEDVLSFLLRMVWQGKMQKALPEAKKFALADSSTTCTRVAAFRAVRTIGSSVDMDEVRGNFLAASTTLNEDMLAELLNDLTPTVSSVAWLFACFPKIDEKKPSRLSWLTEAIVKFVKRADISLIPQIIQKLNILFDTPPLDDKDCRISLQYGWLVETAVRAVELLIEAHDPIAKDNSVLALLYKIAAADSNNHSGFQMAKCSLPALISTWPEYGRKYFWYAVRKTAEEDKKSITILKHRVYTAPLVCFNQTDFMYLVKQIHKRSLPDEKNLALIMAFNLYSDGGKNPDLLTELRKAVIPYPELAEQLRGYLQLAHSQLGKDCQKLAGEVKQQQANSQKERQARLQGNADKLRNNGLKLGQISSLQEDVCWDILEHNGNLGIISAGNLQYLISEYGEEVARAYRDGAMKFWRTYRPQLLSEGLPENKIPIAVCFGLSGLQIEANERTDWIKGLNAQEVEYACRYAIREGNRFPDWFSSLFTAHQKIVSQILLSEIQYELSTKLQDKPMHYTLAKVSVADWAWDTFAPSLCNILKNKEPVNLSNLYYILEIIKNSSISDEDIAKLAAGKCRESISPSNLANWFAVWVSVVPEIAIQALERYLEKIDEKQRAQFAMFFILCLLGKLCSRLRCTSLVRKAFIKPEHLKNLYLLMHRYIHVLEDSKHINEEAYHHTQRDDAQDARESLVQLLSDIPGKETFLALTELSEKHPLEHVKAYFSQQAKNRAELDADITPWSPQQLFEFYMNMQRTPTTHQELAELARLRLLDLKDDFENSDTSIAKILINVSETDIRNAIADKLRDRALGRYSIAQEDELADARRPDLRFRGVGFDGSVPIEIKIADKCTGSNLFERLENQLCGSYLRDRHSACGIFLLVNQGKKRSWKLSSQLATTSACTVSFNELISALQTHWEQSLSVKFSNITRIDVIGIDLMKRVHSDS